MKTYDTVLDALNGLKKEGFTFDFNLDHDSLRSLDSGHILKPHEFDIVNVYRFEGMSDPDENAVVYAIDSKEHGIKGTLLNAYGVYADPVSAELAAKLSIS